MKWVFRPGLEANLVSVAAHKTVEREKGTHLGKGGETGKKAAVFPYHGLPSVSIVSVLGRNGYTKAKLSGAVTFRIFHLSEFLNYVIHKRGSTQQSR